MNFPYKIFFPAAFIFACIGMGVFIPALWGKDFYPIDFHRKMMLEVFMNMAIGGFLLSSVAQFCKNEFLSIKETIFIFFLLAFAGVILIFKYYILFHFLVLSFLIFLLIFVLSRVFSAQTNPPYSFIFIPNALLWGIICELLWTIDYFIPELNMDLYARYLYYHGFILGAIAGVGIRLIPALLGHKEIVLRQKKIYENHKYFFQSIPTMIWNLIALYNLYLLSFLFVSPYYAEYLKLIWLLVIFIFYFKIFNLPKMKSPHSFGVYISLWSIYLGQIFTLLFPEQLSHWLHIMFIGGFFLLATMIITRVTIAHNKLDFKLEKGKWLWVVNILILLAALTRASAYLIPVSYQNHLAYGSILLLSTIAILFWRLKKFQ